MPAAKIRALRSEEHEAAATLIHRSFVHWYETRLGQGARFGPSPAAFRIFPDVYAGLDPGEAMAAFEQDAGKLIGLAFAHPRPSHLTVGLVAVAPEAQGRRVARALIELMLERAGGSGRPVRLLSSVANLDSFSLYTRLGFVPHTLYQQMSLTVPAGGMAHPVPRAGADVRLVTDPREAARLAQFEFEWQGLQREQDYAFLLRNRVGDWRVWAHDGAGGRLKGFLAASLHSGYLMLGPGVAQDEETAADLLWWALNALPGRSPAFLVPANASALVRQCYAWGARNVELLAAQATTEGGGGRGLALPTFLPETG